MSLPWECEELMQSRLWALGVIAVTLAGMLHAGATRAAATASFSVSLTIRESCQIHTESSTSGHVPPPSVNCSHARPFRVASTNDPLDAPYETKIERSEVAEDPAIWTVIF